MSKTITSETMTDLFGPPVSVTTVDDLVATGDLVDARELPDGAGDITNERWPDRKLRILVSRRLHATMQAAVEHPRRGNDWRGVWWDVITMAAVYSATTRAARQARDEGVGFGKFPVIITGAGRRRNYDLVVSVAADLTITFMHPEDR